MSKYITYAFFVAAILGSTVLTQTAVVSADMSAKRDRVDGFIKAIKTRDDKQLTDFIAANFTDESLKQRPISQRLPFLKQVGGDLQGAEIKRLIRLNDDEVNAQLQAPEGDWFTFDFVFDSHPPFKIASVTAQRSSDPPDDAAAKPAVGPPLSESEAVTEIRKVFDDLSTADAFSGVVLIAWDDKPIVAKAYGYANAETKTPNRLDTKFNLGSIDKLFTQIAIGQLFRQGKLSYDDTLIKFLPDYPNKEAAEKITVRELVDHTSGVGDIFGEAYQATPKSKLRRISDFIPLFANKPLAFEPGTKQQYSNGGYILLGAIIEKVTGALYYDYLSKNIFEPLKMTDTAFYESDKPVPNMAEGYTANGVDAASGKKRQNNLFTRPARGSSAGGGYSTAPDLLKFSLAYQQGKITVPDDEHPEIAQSGPPAGLGVAGGSPGVNAILEIMPEKHYTIIVLSNYDPRSAEKPARQVRDLLQRVK